MSWHFQHILNWGRYDRISRTKEHILQHITNTVTNSFHLPHIQANPHRLLTKIQTNHVFYISKPSSKQLRRPMICSKSQKHRYQSHLRGSRTRCSSSARLPKRLRIIICYLIVRSGEVRQGVTLPATASPSGFVELAAGVLAFTVHSCEGAAEWVSCCEETSARKYREFLRAEEEGREKDEGTEGNHGYCSR